MKGKIANSLFIAGIIGTLSLVLFSGCQEKNITQPVGEEPDLPGTEEPLNEEEEEESNYWSIIDIGFAVDSYDGHLFNYTEFADFNNDGYIDIINSSATFSRNGLILYTNSGAGTFFSEDQSNVIFDPADVDLEALGHWGDTMDDVGTFALADYDKDGYLDAVLEGPFTGFTSSLEPVIIFATGDGNVLDPKLILEPLSRDDYIPGLDGFEILGSYYFSSMHSNQVVYRLKYEDHEDDSKDRFMIQAFPFNPDCPYSIFSAHNIPPDGPPECSRESFYGNMLPFQSTIGSGHIGYDKSEIYESESNKDSYLLFGPFIYSDNEQQRAFWGDGSQWGNEFGGPLISPNVRPAQSDIGMFGAESYDILHVMSEVEGTDDQDNSFSIIKDFENQVSTDGSGWGYKFSVYLIETGILKGGIAFDYNEDGLDDIIASILRGPDLEIVVFENRGDYVFEETDIIQSLPVSDEPDFVRLIKYDFNNDGKMELYLQGLGKIIIRD